MNEQIRKIGILKRISFWLLLWGVLFSYYATSVKYNFFPQISDYLVYITQLFADFVLLYVGYFAYKRTQNLFSKKFYFLILLSIIVGLCSTEIYNVLFNILRTKNILSTINILWILPYTIFLFIQIYAWFRLVLIKSKRSNKHIINIERL